MPHFSAHFPGRLLAFGAAFFVLAAAARAQTIPAFPGAEGAGAFAKGGRGGDVYHVTNTNASGAGSLAYGLTTGVPAAGRTIVFDVSGYAHISKELRITASKITVAGQTAPGDGFGLKDGTFRVSGDDIVIRHLRFRDGNSADSIDFDSGSQNAILDHTDAMFSNDENFSSFGSPPENLTFQWSLNAWGMESHSAGGLWDMSHTTTHHTLWAHNHTRNPKVRAGLLDWVNNVTFDWDIGFIMGDSPSNATWRANVRGCYFISGTSKTTALEKASLQTSNGLPNFNLYMEDSALDGNINGLLDVTRTNYAMASGSYNTSATPFPMTANFQAVSGANPLIGVPVTQDGYLLAYKKIVSNAGPLRLDVDAAKPLRDEVATLLISELVAQTHHHVSNVTGTGLGNGGFGTLNSAAAPLDTDKDGMPDYYETALGWSAGTDDHNTALASSGGVITGTTFFPTGTVAGYTRLEEYLHFLAIPHGTLAKNVTGTPSSIAVDMRKFTSGFSAAPTFTVANVSGGAVVLSGTGNAIATFTPTLNYTGRSRFDFTVTDSAGSAWTQTCALVVTASGLPRDLIWKGDGTSNVWDSSANNWQRNAAATSFSVGDRVAFDDTGSLSPSVNVTGTVSPTTVEVNATGNYIFAGEGAVSAAGALTKRGSGTLTISNAAANSFSAVSLDEGLLSLGSFNAAGGGKMSLNGGSLFLSTAIGNPLEFNAPTTITVGSQQTMTGNWTGTQALTINGTSSYLWSVSGTWTGFTGAINFGSGNVRMRMSGGNSNTMYGSPAVAINLGSGTSQIMNRNGSATTPFEMGSLESSGSGTALYGTQTGTVNSTYSIGALNTDTTFAGSIVNGGGTTSIIKVGTGAWTLTGTSSHTGTTTVSDGALIVALNLGTSPVTVASGAMLAGSGTIGGTVTASAGAILSPGTAPFTGATMTVGSGLALNGNTLYFDMSGSSAGANDKIALSGGLLALTGTQYFQFLLLQSTLAAGTYDLITGATSISASGFTLTHNLPTGTRQTFALAPVGTIVRLTVTGDPATLTWTGATSATWDTATANNFSGATPNTFGANDAVIFDDTTAVRNLTLTGSLTPRSIVVNTAAGYTLGGAGTLDGAASLVKNGAGTLTLAGSAANTFTGGLTLNAGTIVLANDAANAGALGTGPVTLNGGVISMHDDATSYDNFYANLVVPAGATARINADSRVDMYGTLSGAGTLNFFIPYIRTTLFTDWSAFTGVLNVLTDASGGDLRMGTSYFFPGFPLASVVLADKVAAYYTGTLNGGAGTTIEIGELSGSALSALGGGATGGRNFTYRIGGKTLAGSEAVFAGSIYEQNTGTATSYVKTGAGTWTLSGSGAWNGGTVVEQGTLKITGFVTCGAATNVATAAALTLANGTLTTDALNIASGAVFTGSGSAALHGDFNNDGTATLTGGTFTVTGDAVNNGTLRFTGGAALTATGAFVNNGLLDLLSGAQSLPANLENNGVIIDSSSLRMTSAAKIGNTVTVTAQTYAAHTYQLQRADSLIAPVWGDIAGQAFAGNGSPHAFTDTAATGTQRFYHIRVTP